MREKILTSVKVVMQDLSIKGVGIFLQFMKEKDLTSAKIVRQDLSIKVNRHISVVHKEKSVKGCVNSERNVALTKLSPS